MPAENIATETLYSDKLIKITRDGLTLSNYYFPGVSKKVLAEKSKKSQLKIYRFSPGNSGYGAPLILIRGSP